MSRSILTPSTTSQLLSIFILVLITMNNIEQTQGFAGGCIYNRITSSIVSRQINNDKKHNNIIHQTKNKLLPIMRKAVMMDTTQYEVDYINTDITTKDELTMSISSFDADIEQFRQEMIDLEYEIFFLEEDIMHIVHEKKEIVMQQTTTI